MLEFHVPSLSDKQYFTVGSSLLAYEYQFSYCMLWQETDRITVCKTEVAFYIHNNAQGAFLLPITEHLDKALVELEDFCMQTDTPFVLECVPKEQALALKQEGFHIEHTRDLDDYLYSGEKLVTLSGKHLQSKRNHISQFKRDYSYTVSFLTEKDIPDCLALDWLWIQKNEDEKETREERIAIKRAFKYWKEIGFIGAVIRIEGKLVAFTIGEIIDSRLAISHFEKADVNYLGIYSVINQEYASLFLKDIQYVNRQEDVGLEGLRRSKLSYHPLLMVEKYKVTKEEPSLVDIRD
ncbi:MAG: phosphatidylglycerol lysyltransferase domain-containing protein [Sphaerochaetaceae bacterium]